MPKLGDILLTLGDRWAGRIGKVRTRGLQTWNPIFQVIQAWCPLNIVLISSPTALTALPGQG